MKASSFFHLSLMLFHLAFVDSSYFDIVCPYDTLNLSVDEFLAHLIRYRSTAPYVANSLIQYHGISNPSPGFVQRVSHAFMSGSFTSGGITFGNNKYGDLKAVVAAISLDPESLTPVMDEDPVSGNIREPLLKVMQVLRSLSFQRRPSVKFRYGLFDNMAHKIGQMVFDPPDQFSFFAKDYMPPGVFAETGLVSPEAELLSMSSVVGIVSSLLSTRHCTLCCY